MGDYIQSQLGKDEYVVYETKNHWIMFLSVPAVLTLFIGPIIARISNEFAITNKRIIIKEGLISRRSLEINIPPIGRHEQRYVLGAELELDRLAPQALRRR